MTSRLTAGIDAGSRTLKIVLTEADGARVVASGVRGQGLAPDALADELLAELLDEAGAGRGDIRRTVATGYARNIISSADTTVTEITCHACGVRRVAPEVQTIVEIGGQDSKLIKLDEAGRVRDFAMNDRCAAGTGRFLEMLAGQLEVPLDGLGDLARKSADPAAISSMCVVFAETEIVGLLARGTPREDIVAGVQAAITSRVATMAGANVSPPVVFTGGVAMVPAMDSALSDALGLPVAVAPEPQMTGALGAAIIAARQAAETRQST